MHNHPCKRPALLVPVQADLWPESAIRHRSIGDHNFRWSALADVLRKRQAMGYQRMERIAWLPVDAFGEPARLPTRCNNVLQKNRESHSRSGYLLGDWKKPRRINELIREERAGLSIQESARVRDIRLSDENCARVCSKVGCLLRFAFGCYVDAKGVWPFAEIL